MQANRLAFFGTPERDLTATTASGGLGTIHYATGARFHAMAMQNSVRFPKTETIIPKRAVKHKGF